MSDTEGLVELLAAECHSQWANWMHFLKDSTVTDKLVDDCFRIEVKAEDYFRWRRQMKASYSDLKTHEKESDRKAARRLINILIDSGYLEGED